jgi:2-polyprenyl-3-methyl-5-hydroxy-6-metoxy-1,4-benzoquinol methylase
MIVNSSAFTYVDLEKNRPMAKAREPVQQANSAEDIQDWNRIADRYLQEGGTSGSFVYRQFETVLWESLGELQGLEVLDLGCGYGWFAEMLHQAGANVCGVDGSNAFLAHARAAYPHIAFTQYDLMEGLPPLDRAFDRIVALMVLMDIPEIGSLMADVRGHLKDDGKFIFTIPHPVFFGYKTQRDEQTGVPYRRITGYLKPEVWWIETFGGHNHYHRSLTHYADQLRENSLAITRLYEPPHQVQQVQTDPEMEEFYKGIPIFILIETMPLRQTTVLRHAL